MNGKNGNEKEQTLVELIFFSIKKLFFNVINDIVLKFKYIKKYLKGYSYDSDIKNLKYVSLSPVDDIEKSDTYFSALDWAIKDEKVSNIALSGPYGSGKSSIIQSYLKKNPHLHYINISLASFCESGKGLIDFPEEKIEEGILKQLFYKVNYKKIPHSRYRKIHNLKYRSVALSILSVIVVFMIFFTVLKPINVLSINSTIEKTANIFMINRNIVVLMLTVSALILWAFFSYILWFLIVKFKVVKVNVFEKAEMTEKATTDSSVFNKNLDEILYFFETSKYDIVFIEDLDRFENAEIFIKLRELNTLLNNYEMIKRRIVFVYAIKDDMFTKDDRTKFFDFIIPVIPIINSTNSGEKMLKRIKEDRVEADISESFINRISVYIDDMRILNNVFNEFIVFKSIVNDINGLNDEVMFTLIIFKNLYPKEFTDLQHEKGIVYKAFARKKAFIKEHRDKYINKRKENEQILKRIDNDYLKSLKELKQAILYDLVGDQCLVYRIDIRNGIYNSIGYNEYMQSDFDIDKLEGKRLTIHYYYLSGSSSYTNQITKDLSTQENSNFFERFDFLKYSSEEHKKRIIKEIDFYRREEHSIQSYKLVDLLKDYKVSDVLEQDILDNKFLVFALRNAYIDEYYANYLNYFHPNSITKDDMNFIMAVRNREALEFDYELSKVQQVVQRLEEYEFEQKEIYNINLLEYLLSTMRNDKKCDVYIKQLADGTEESNRFIDEFISITSNIADFTNRLCSKHHKFWKYIENKTSFSSERKHMYLTNILKYAEVNDIILMEKNSNMSGFILGTRNILSYIDEDRMITLIDKLNLKFISLNCYGVNQRILNYIFDNLYYEINVEMIQNIIEFRFPELVDRLSTANYSSIMETGYEPLIENINEHLEEYVENVLLNINTNTNESLENILVLIEKLITNVRLCEKIIEKEEFIIKDINMICDIEIDEKFNKNLNKLCNKILYDRKVLANWKTIFGYHSKWGISNVLLDFINTNINKLKKEEMKDINEDDKLNFMKEIIISSLDEKAYRELAKIIQVDMSEIEFSEITWENMQILIELKYFPLNSEFYNEVKENFEDLNIEYLCNNKESYIQNIREYELDVNELIQILKSDIFSKKEKIKIVEVFGSDNITVDIANMIYNYPIEMSTELVDVLWEKVNSDGRYELLYNQLKRYTNRELANKFEELGGVYAQLATNSKQVKLLKSTYNEKLGQALKERGYISSIKLEIKEKKIKLNNIIGINKVVDLEETLVLRVKKKFN